MKSYHYIIANLVRSFSFPDPFPWPQFLHVNEEYMKKDALGGVAFRITSSPGLGHQVSKNLRAIWDVTQKKFSFSINQLFVGCALPGSLFRQCCRIFSMKDKQEVCVC